MKRYSAMIIGTGQAGPSLAGYLAGKGEKIAIAEGNLFGGSCVNYGCTPSKTIIASALIAHHARAGAKWGVHAEDVTIDMDKVMERKQERVLESRNGLRDWLMNEENVDVYEAYAHFEGKENGVFRIGIGEDNDEIIEAERVYINVGTRARIPDLPGLDSVDYMTNADILNLHEIPDHLITLGGGYISLEMGQAFRRFGAEVTIIERSESIIHREDADVRDEVRNILQNEGITVLEGKEVVGTSQAADGTITVTLKDGDDTESMVSGSHLLVAIGRTPNSDTLNLDAVGVETKDHGDIVTNEYLETNIPGIFALGDVNGRGAFTHTSYWEFELVRDNLEGADRKVSDRNMAYAMYIDPALGRVGMSEQEARDSGKNVLMATMPMSSVSRALEQGETQGFIKFLVDADTEQFLGATVLGMRGDDLIQIIAFFMATGASYKVMQNALPVHPTVAELFPTVLGKLEPLK